MSIDTEAAAYDDAYDATLAAMKDLGFAVQNEQKSPLSATITARGAGDKSRSQLMLDNIKSHF